MTPKTSFRGRLLAAFIALWVALPFPAHALRTQSGDSEEVRAGLEETLRFAPSPAAGLEGAVEELEVELDPVALARLSPAVRRLVQEIVSPGVERILRFDSESAVPEPPVSPMAARLDFLSRLNASVLLPEGAALEVGEQNGIRLIPAEGYELWKLPEADGLEKWIPLVYTTAPYKDPSLQGVPAWHSVDSGMAIVRIDSDPGWMQFARTHELTHAEDSYRFNWWGLDSKTESLDQLYKEYGLHPEAHLREFLPAVLPSIRENPLGIADTTIREVRAELRQLAGEESERSRAFDSLRWLASYPDRSDLGGLAKEYLRKEKPDLGREMHPLTDFWIADRLISLGVKVPGDFTRDLAKKIWEENFTDPFESRLQRTDPTSHSEEEAQLNRLASLAGKIQPSAYDLEDRRFRLMRGPGDKHPDISAVLELGRLHKEPLGVKPWDLKTLSSRIGEPNVDGAVIEDRGKRILGSSVHENEEDWISILDHAVLPGPQSGKIERFMIRKWKSMLRPGGRTSLVLYVPKSDRKFKDLLLAEGFQSKLVRGYFKDTGQNAYKMTFQLPAAGLEETRAALAAARELVEGYRSAIETPKAAVIGGSLAGRFLGLQVLAGMEEHVFLDRGDPAGTAIRLAEQGITHVQYFGGLEETRHFTSSANPLGIEVTARNLQDPTSLFLLREILFAIGVPERVIASGLEELDRGLQELGQAA